MMTMRKDISMLQKETNFVTMTSKTNRLTLDIRTQLIDTSDNQVGIKRHLANISHHGLGLLSSTPAGLVDENKNLWLEDSDLHVDVSGDNVLCDGEDNDDQQVMEDTSSSSGIEPDSASSPMIDGADFSNSRLHGDGCITSEEVDVDYGSCAPDEVSPGRLRNQWVTVRTRRKTFELKGSPHSGPLTGYAQNSRCQQEFTSFWNSERDNDITDSDFSLDHQALTQRRCNLEAPLEVKELEEVAEEEGEHNFDEHTSGEDTSDKETSSEDTSGKDFSLKDASNQNASGKDTSGEETSGEDASGKEASGEGASAQDVSNEDAFDQNAWGKDTSCEDASGEETDVSPGGPTQTWPRAMGARRSSLQAALEQVKALTTRLNLTTRRPSIVAWTSRSRAQMRQLSASAEEEPEDEEGVQEEEDGLKREDVWQRLEDPGVSDLEGSPPVVTPDAHEDGEAPERPRAWCRVKAAKITHSLSWIKEELVSLREQDAGLARELVGLRQDMHRLKLLQSCGRHQDLLDDAADIEVERDRLSALCQLDLDLDVDHISPTLKQCGVTRMNITARRFSVY